MIMTTRITTDESMGHCGAARGARRGAVRRVTGLARGGAVLAEQAAYSVTTLITSILLARAGSSDAYGIFILGMSLVYFTEVIQRSLVAVPFSVLCHARDGEEEAYVANTLIQHLLLMALTVAAFVAIGTAGSFFGQAGPVWSSAAFCAMAAPGLHGRVVTRAVLLGRLRVWTNLAVGATASVLTTLAVVCLYAGGRLTNVSACLALCAPLPVLAGAVVWAERGRLRLNWSRFGVDLGANWHYGKWIVIATCANALGVRLVPWLVCLWGNTEQVAAFGATATVALAVRPVIEASQAYLTPRFALRVHKKGAAAARRSACSFLRPACAAGAVYAAALAVAGGWVLQLAYPRYAHEQVTLAILGVAVAAKIVNVPIRSLLAAVGRPKTLSSSSIGASAACLAGAIVLIPRWGAAGAAGAMLIYYLVILAINTVDAALRAGVTGDSHGVTSVQDAISHSNVNREEVHECTPSCCDNRR